MKKTIEIEERDLFLLLVVIVRYAMERDNHLAPGISCDLVEKYSSSLEKETKIKLFKQLEKEIEFNLRIKKYSNEKLWKKFLEKIKTKED